MRTQDEDEACERLCASKAAKVSKYKQAKQQAEAEQNAAAAKLQSLQRQKQAKATVQHIRSNKLDAETKGKIQSKIQNDDIDATATKANRTIETARNAVGARLSALSAFESHEAAYVTAKQVADQSQQDFQNQEVLTRVVSDSSVPPPHIVTLRVSLICSDGLPPHPPILVKAH